MSSGGYKCKEKNPVDDYVILFTDESFLGRGIQGWVYKCQDRKTGEICAIKKVAFQPDNPELPEFNNEVNIHSQLSHPNIVKFVECYSLNHEDYLVLEYAPYGTITEYTTSDDYNGCDAIVYKILKQVISALEYCHSKKILHGDIRGANILIKNFIQGIPHILLADFGVSTDYVLEYSRHYAPPQWSALVQYDIEGLGDFIDEITMSSDERSVGIQDLSSNCRFGVYTSIDDVMNDEWIKEMQEIENLIIEKEKKEFLSK